jgi:hypothetical protein
MSKYPGGVELYSLNNNLLKTFNNNVELATYLKISLTPPQGGDYDRKIYKIG